MPVNPLESVTRQVAAYGAGAEQWKADHDRAMECLDLELLLQWGLSCYDAINFADEKVRSLARSGKLEFTPEVADVITTAYRSWMKPCETVIRQLEAFERDGFSVEKAERFRSACREVRGILTDDAEFFGDGLVELRDGAIDAFRTGECAPA